MSAGARAGQLLLGAIEEAGELCVLTGKTLRSLARRPVELEQLLRQLSRVGVGSLPLVLWTAAFTGMVVAFQTFAGFTRFRAEAYVGALVALSMLRELAPVITALMVTGRVGSAMAAELASMRVSEQIDALVAMATDPIHYLLVPRVLAGVVMLPVLVVTADAVGILGGRAIAVWLLGANATVYDRNTFLYLEVRDLVMGLVKAAAFGFIFSTIACQKGFMAKGGAEGVGRATTRAVVVASLCVVMADFFLTKVLA